MAKDEDCFLLALEALKPYLPDIVISGGWVPFVYHRYLETARPDHRPLGTKDVDIAVPANARRRPGRVSPRGGLSRLPSGGHGRDTTIAPRIRGVGCPPTRRTA